MMLYYFVDVYKRQHERTALAAEQLGGQQIAHILFCGPTMGNPVLLKTLLHPVKMCIRDRPYPVKAIAAST